MHASKRKRRTGIRPATVQSARPVSTRHLMAGPAKQRKATKMTGAQRNSIGRTSEWAMSMEVNGRDKAVVIDRAWSQTVQNPNR